MRGLTLLPILFLFVSGCALKSNKPKTQQVYAVQIRETVSFDESSPPPPAPTEVFEIYNLDEPPQPLVQVQPEYPEKAKKAKLEGRVIVVAVVDENGDVIQASIHHSDNPIFN